MKKLLMGLLLAGSFLLVDGANAQTTKPVKHVKKTTHKTTCSCESQGSSSLNTQTSAWPSNRAINNGPFDKETADSLYMYGRMPYGGIIDTTHHNIGGTIPER